MNEERFNMSARPAEPGQPATPSNPAPQPSVSAPSEPQQMPQPVAYDQQGRPLYAAPPVVNNYQNNSPQLVYLTRAMDPGKTEIPPEIMQRHEASKKEFPQLNLSDGEYIILAVRRHPFGLFQIWLMAFALIAAFLAVLIGYLTGGGGVLDTSSGLPIAMTVLGILFVLILAGAVVASFIYNNNRFYLTNESVIQEIQVGIFSKHEQTVSLANIEDASYKQNGIVPAIFNFGLIRLSTEGDETTYRFNYVANPKKVLAILNDAVEAFKNFRRVGH